MRDYFIAFFLIGLVALSFYKPWFATFTYLYADVIQPQRLSYYLLRSVPINFWLGALAVVLFLFDKKKMLRFGMPQALMLLFIAWFTVTSNMAIIQDEQVWFKWDAAWKSVLFGGIFLPFVLATRQRLEAVIILVVLCVGLVTVSGGLKTLAGGGGYEELSMIVQVNKGLYESSTVATVGIAVIPLILYLYRHSPLVGRNGWTRAIAGGLILSSLLIVVGTEARTGVICFAALAAMMFWRARRKFATLLVAGAIGLAALPLLPASFAERAQTIIAFDEDVSASSRVGVWQWTLGFVREYPQGGGFRVSRLNEIEVRIARRSGDGEIIGYRTIKDQARGFHSSYFEVLAEHGIPGLLLYGGIITSVLLSLWRLRARFRDAMPEDRWIPDLAQALFRAVAIYAVGGLFVALAFQTTLYMFLAFGIALGHQMAERRLAERRAARLADFARRMPRRGSGVADGEPLPA